MGLFDDEVVQVNLEELDWLDEQIKLNMPEYQSEDVGEVVTTPQVLSSYVRISDDHMTAWIYLENKERAYRPMEISDLLSRYGVVKGIDYDMVKAIIEKQVYEMEIVVAEGKPAEEGEEGHYEFFFDTQMYHKPRILEDGSVDYTSMSELANVEKDQLIAKYHPAMAGVPGYGVDGTEISVGRNKDLPKLKGKGFYVGQNPNEYYASKEGKITLKNDRIDIEDVHKVRGDVDLITGKIEFYGDVEIQGTVAAGVVIKAGRNIIVSGVVSGAELYAGGDIILKKGLQGGNRAKIYAKGDVYAEFIEYAAVRTGGSVEANTFLSSYISADGEVHAKGSKGSIIGGYVHGLQGVKARNIGNEVEVKTVIHVGYEKEAYNKFALLSKKQTDAEKLYKNIVGKLVDLQKETRLKNIPAYKMEQVNRELLELAGQQEQYGDLLKKIKAEKETLNTIIEIGRGAKAIAENKVFSGCVIGTERAQIVIGQDMSCRMFYYENGAVENRVLH